MSEDEVRVDEGRRSFLRTIAALSAFVSFGGLVGIINSLNPSFAAIPLEWPRVRVARVEELKVGEPVIFNYPLDTTPNILVKLGVRVEGGVGPDGDIVAYSQICQHLGCFVRYLHPGRYGDVKVPEKLNGKHLFYCGCHAAFYDVVEKAKPVAGPPVYPLPPVLLEYVEETGEIIAYGMGPPVIYGHGPPGSDNVMLDLRGGRLVSG